MGLRQVQTSAEVATERVSTTALASRGFIQWTLACRWNLEGEQSVLDSIPRVLMHGVNLRLARRSLLVLVLCCYSGAQQQQALDFLVQSTRASLAGNMDLNK